LCTKVPPPSVGQEAEATKDCSAVPDLGRGGGGPAVGGGGRRSGRTGRCNLDGEAEGRSDGGRRPSWRRCCRSTRRPSGCSVGEAERRRGGGAGATDEDEGTEG